MGFPIVFQQRLVRILFPADDIAGFNGSSVKMPAFFCNGKPLFLAELVGKRFLLLQILFRLMQFVAVNIRNGVRNNMTVQMIFILVDTNQGLVIREKLVGKLTSHIEDFGRGDLLVLMETYDVVRVHPSGIFVP